MAHCAETCRMRFFAHACRLYARFHDAWNARSSLSIGSKTPICDAGQELNKGESRNSLARAVFIHRLGEIRDRTYENQQHRASGLNLVVSAIILWNTRYLERAVDVLRKFEDVPASMLAHLSPLGWEHVNLTGDYVWGVEQSLSENIDGLRPLRTQADAFQKAA